MAQWNIDPAHSEIQFKVKHLVISTVTGQFNQFEGSVQTDNDQDFSNAHVNFSAEVTSISTNNSQRDEHLKSDDFFGATSHPKITFSSKTMEKIGDVNYKLHGDLTIKGVTKPVELVVEHGGTQVDPYGNTKAGFEITGKINRKDFGLNWSATTEAGGVVVSDEVKLYLNVQVAKQA